MSHKSIYKTPEDKEIIAELYTQKLASLDIQYEEQQVDTFAGKTNVITVGEAHLPPLVLFHGINAGTPLALEAIKGLATEYRIYGIDTVGQATRSAETVLPLHDDSYGRWAVDVLDALGLDKAAILGVSYGAFIVQRLIAYAPQRLERALFVVPSGFANGPLFESIFKLLMPMYKFKKSKKEADLLKFMDAFYVDKDPFSVAFQKAILLGVHLDTRRPPLLSKKETKDFDAPVYMLVAEHDIFFPSPKTIKKAKSLFKNLRRIEVLKGGKHVPTLSTYGEIERIVGEFMRD